eukprot:scaffold4395_cov411-Prasinococcus_capsulatus_cf.AAC.1
MVMCTPSHSRASCVSLGSQARLWRCTAGHASTTHYCHPKGHRLELRLLVSFARVSANLLVILLEGRKIFACLREFTLFHALANVPVNEGALGIHKVEL